jgi:hypothetical protein
MTSGYLRRLAARAIGTAAPGALRPRVPSLFEPSPAGLPALGPPAGAHYSSGATDAEHSEMPGPADPTAPGSSLPRHWSATSPPSSATSPPSSATSPPSLRSDHRDRPVPQPALRTPGISTAAPTPDVTRATPQPAPPAGPIGPTATPATPHARPLRGTGPEQSPLPAVPESRRQPVPGTHDVLTAPPRPDPPAPKGRGGELAEPQSWQPGDVNHAAAVDAAGVRSPPPATTDPVSAPNRGEADDHDQAVRVPPAPEGLSSASIWQRHGHHHPVAGTARRPSHHSDEATVVRVSIGRIEVHGMLPAQPQAAAAPPAPPDPVPEPAISLERYLSERARR